jgi:hypothetical protein
MDSDAAYLPIDDNVHDLLTQAADPPPAFDGFDANIAFCARFHARFSLQIDAHWLDRRPRLLASALSVHARVAVRLADVLRIRCELDGPASPPVDVDHLVADLEGKIARLGAYIDDRWPDPLTPNGYRFLQLYSANLGRLTRLYHHRRALARLQARHFADRIAGAGDIARAFDRALDQLGKEWGIQL